MTAFSEFLNTDGNGVETSAVHDGTKWVLSTEVADGDDVTVGLKADTAVTDPTSSATVVALLKGLLSFLRTSATGLGKAEDAAHVSGDVGVQALSVRKDTAAATAGTDGDYQPLITDSTGKLHVVDSSNTKVMSNASSTALADDKIVKASAGTLYGFQGYVDSGAADGFVQVHNTTTQPADTAVPVESFPVAAGAGFSLDFGRHGRYCSTGITIVFSSTGPTLTAGGAFMFVGAQYE